MQPAQVDTYGLLAAFLPLTFTILVGVLTLAWRLGRLEQTVHEQDDDLADSQRDRREIRTDMANLRSDVAAMKADVRDIKGRLPDARS